MNDFQDTRPATMAHHTGRAIDEFCVNDTREIVALCRRLADAGTLVHLSDEGQSPYTSVIWAVDAAAGRIALDADPAQPAVQALVAAGEATAVAYLDAIKLQFDLHPLVLVHGGTGSALQAPLPTTMYRFQRRSCFRVRARGGATAHLRHPALPDMTLALRVLDVSIGGCALAVPGDVPGFEAGVTIGRVRIELDADTRFESALTIQHVSGGFAAAGNGTRLGCAFGKLDGAAQRALQCFIDLSQRRQRLLTPG